ncbi:MAG: ABC transporter permease [Victivallales bacterium]|nr:ABC transporter permease [Victivallales bacterium]
MRDRIAAISLVVVVGYLLLAIGSDVYGACCRSRQITPAYNRTDMNHTYQPPSWAHPLGTDFMGRDVLLRAVAGSATAMKVGVAASLLAVLIGVSLGVAAGYFGGRVDHFALWIYSTFAAMPTLLFILAFALLVSRGFLYAPLADALHDFSRRFHVDTGMIAVYLGIGLTGWVSLCQVVRSETMRLREAVYVQAAKTAGHGALHIIVRHILPNLFHLVIIYFTMRFALAIMTEVIVSYLGLGVQLAPSWGVMIADGQERLWRGIWWEVAAATGFMFVLVLALNLLGDALRDILDPKLRS